MVSKSQTRPLLFIAVGECNKFNEALLVPLMVYVHNVIKKSITNCLGFKSWLRFAKPELSRLVHLTDHDK